MRLPALLDRAGLAFLSRLLAGGIFLFAALAKIGDPAAFATAISRYEIVPSLANLGGLLLPWMELVLAVALLAGLWPRAAALGMCGLYALFIPAMLWALAMGLKVDCGCFGGWWSGPLTWGTLLRDGAFLLPCLHAALATTHRKVLLEG